MMKNAYLPKISFLLQFGAKILALLCSDDSIQILLILPQFRKIRRICMQSSGHNIANTSPPNCNKMLIFGK